MQIGKALKVAALCVMMAPLLAGRSLKAEEGESFPHPAELEPDVRFWIRVYTEVTTDGGFIHDDWNLKLVYEVLRFDPDSSPGQRERRVAESKARYAALLKRFAAGQTSDLSAHERRILHAFGENATPRDYLDAIDRIRFQLGQADRFHEGLIRAAAWETHIARVLKEHGVPVEIAALPHVESSFNPAAYSKVGAAGLWQFMPSTAKRFMRVDGIVDERLDPYSATEAAANLMLYNYRLLGSWPLAVTAYNHGPGGLRRAQDELGTSDIAVIVKRYQGATFGFASRNFYVAFLAALEVDRNAEKYFGPLTRLPDTENTPVELPDYIAVGTLAKAFKVDLGALKVLNPALRPPIWNGSRLVPRGYALRLPGVQSESEIAAAWERVPTTQRYVAQRNDGSHRVRKGETLAGIAAASGMSVARLMAANGWNGAHAVARGEVVRIPLPATRAEAAGQVPASVAANLPPPGSPAPEAMAAASPPPGASPPLAAGSPAAGTAGPQSPAAESAAPAAEKIAAPPREPVTRRQTESAALLPAGPPTGGTDTTDYGVAADDTVVVQVGETLGHFSDWSGVDSQRLRALNRLHKDARVTVGHRIKLDLSKVTAEQFTAARREYHHRLQEEFFAAHRIAGTESYVVKRGESLWTIAQQHADLPIWLVAQYNPDVNFGDIRPGTTIALPKIVDINRQ
ncbi:MAG: transglycosylase SLT domain-containing protein [Steroidobacteraceae bacterium]